MSNKDVTFAAVLTTHQILHAKVPPPPPLHAIVGGRAVAPYSGNIKKHVESVLKVERWTVIIMPQ